VEWDGSKGTYKDVVARCSKRERYTTAGEKCEAYTIMAPSLSIAPTSKRIKAPQSGGIEKLYAHQSEAVERYKRSTVIPLFFEAGCGKSATILRIIKERYDRKEIDTVLIIAPNKVHNQWHREQIPKWLSDTEYNAQLFGGYRGKKDIYPLQDDVLNIITVNVDTFSTADKWKKIIKALEGRDYFIILDEATTIKNIQAKRTNRILYAFNKTKYRGRAIIESVPLSKGRAILTGTPVTNALLDIWSLMEFLQPNFFGKNYYAFKNRYGMFYKMYTQLGTTVDVLINEEVWGEIKRSNNFEDAQYDFGITLDTYHTIKEQPKYQGCYKHAEEIKEKLDTIASFVKLTDCMDMPPQHFIKRIIPMGDDQEKAYRDMEENAIAQYGEGECTAQMKLTLFIRLQQISSGFIPVDICNDEEDIRKELLWFKDVPKLDALYRDIDDSEKPCVIITRFSAEAARIYDDLSEKYITCLQTGWRQAGSIEGFQNGEFDIMVANVQVISKGFNLQRASSMFFYSNTFSLENRIQSEGRIYRINQTNPCNYFDYINEDTIDMKVVAALKQRRELMDYIKAKPVATFLNEWDDIFEQEYGDIYSNSKPQS
jgi:superfamily II DNA or RNA helicase